MKRSFSATSSNADRKVMSEEELQDMLFGSKSTLKATSSQFEELYEIEQSHRVPPSSSAVWHDDDDDAVMVDIDNSASRLKKLRKTDGSHKISASDLSNRLRDRYDSKKQLAWATVTEPDEDDYLRNSTSLIDSSSESKWKGMLQSGKIDIARISNLNVAEPTKEPISVVKFSQNSNLALVGSNDKYIRLFQVDGDKNEKVLGVKFQNWSVSSADFLSASPTSEPNEIIVAGKRPHLYSYDIVSGSITKVLAIVNCKTKLFSSIEKSKEGTYLALMGRDGYTHIMSAKYKSWVMDLKMNCAVKAASFLDDHVLMTSGEDTEVYIWDLRYSGKCVHKFTNDDGTPTHSLATLPKVNITDQNISSKSYTSNYLLAVGAESGVVNVYDGNCTTKDSLLSHTLNRKKKSIMNLTTTVTSCKFHPTGDILAIGTNEKKNGLKLVHVPTGTVFSNWPKEKTPLKRVTCLDFSPGGAFFAIGNNRGGVLLYRLKQYDQM